MNLSFQSWTICRMVVTFAEGSWVGVALGYRLATPAGISIHHHFAWFSTSLIVHRTSRIMAAQTTNMTYDSRAPHPGHRVYATLVTIRRGNWLQNEKVSRFTCLVLLWRHLLMPAPVKPENDPLKPHLDGRVGPTELQLVLRNDNVL